MSSPLDKLAGEANVTTCEDCLRTPWKCRCERAPRELAWWLMSTSRQMISYLESKKREKARGGKEVKG